MKKKKIDVVFLDTLLILVMLFPWIQSYSDDPWTLLRLADSPDPRVRSMGVMALAQQHHWHGTSLLVILVAPPHELKD